jgi:hypothetical protein
MLSQTVNLHVFRASAPIGYRDLMQLTMASSLRALSVGKVEDLPTGIFPLPPGAFKQLDTLHIRDRSDSGQLTRSILKFRSGNSLKTCSICFYRSARLSVKDYFSILCELKVHKGLKYIEVTTRYDNPIALTLEQSSTFFGTLQTLSQLERLHIGGALQPGLSVNTSIIKSLLESCPRLESWRIGDSYPPTMNYAMSFDDFLDLLQYHRLIKELPVSIIIDNLPTVSRMLRFGTHNYGPCFFIQGDKLTDPARLVIAQLFPCVLHFFQCTAFGPLPLSMA